MTCASCVQSVENRLKTNEGVSEVNVNLATNTASVNFDRDQVSPVQLQKSLQEIGYDILLEEDELKLAEEIESVKKNEAKRLSRDLIWSGVLTVPIAILSMVFPEITFSEEITALLATPVLFIFGKRFYIGAWKQLTQGSANMNTLVALSTSIAYCFSLFNLLNPAYYESKGLSAHVYFEASAVIIFFILLGKWLEEQAKIRTATSIKKLLGLQPKSILVKNQSGQFVSKLIKEVVVDDLILIQPGDKIPVDGTVIEGLSFVDERALTGEPIAIEKQTNDSVTSGSINQQGTFIMRAEKVGNQTFLNQLIKMVEDAQGSKAQIQSLVDKVAGVFVPIVLVIALLSLGIWLVFGGENAVTYGLISMVSVLVIACPCALGLATPTAIMVGIGRGSENGILIKNAESLELAYKVNTVVFDKTGTITIGKPSVQKSHWIEDQKEYDSILFSIETKSNHPLAQSVIDHLSIEKNQSIPKIQSFTNLPGKGVMATVDNKNFFVGSQRLLKEMRLELHFEIEKIVEEWESLSYTIVYFFDRKKLISIFGIADQIKDTSKAAIESLINSGIAVAMLTGDQQRAAEKIAKDVGIKSVYASLLPQDKANIIKDLQAQGQIVAMVGDGINDSQALAQADVSIAMGQGADIAIEVASMTIPSSNLIKIHQALQLSKSTIKTIRQNLFWAFIYNIIGIPIAAGLLFPFNGFLLSPMIASAAMAMSSVSVVLNSLKLKFVK